MGAFLSLRKTVGLMAAAAVVSYIIMRIHSIYLENIPVGADAPWSEIFFAVQTGLLVCEWILGLIAVGNCIFYRPSLTGAAGVLLKLLLIGAAAAVSLFAVWLVARFGGANAVSSVGMKIFLV